MNPDPQSLSFVQGAAHRWLTGLQVDRVGPPQSPSVRHCTHTRKRSSHLGSFEVLQSVSLEQRSPTPTALESGFAATGAPASSPHGVAAWASKSSIRSVEHSKSMARTHGPIHALQRGRGAARFAASVTKKEISRKKTSATCLPDGARGYTHGQNQIASFCAGVLRSGARRPRRHQPDCFGCRRLVRAADRVTLHLKRYPTSPLDGAGARELTL